MTTSRTSITRSIRSTILLLTLAIMLTGCSSGSLLAGSSWPGLSIDGNQAYIAFGTSVYSIDRTNGRATWRFPAETDRATNFYAPPAPSEDGLVVVGSYSNILYGLRSRGSLVDIEWTFEEASDRYIAAATIVGDLVLAPNADGHLYALDLETGTNEWTYTATVGNALWSAPLVYEDRVYLSSLDHELYCIDIANGEECWKQDLGGSIPSTPAHYEDVLLAGTFGGEFFAIAIEDGAIRWSIETEGWIWGTPAVAGTYAFFGDLDGNLTAIDLENEGAEVWRQSLGSAITAAPIVDDENVYFISEDGVVNAYNQLTGEPAWGREAVIEGTLNADAALVDDALFIPALGNDCLLFAVGTEAGSLRCEFQPE